MIKVVKKTFDVLELALESRGKPSYCGELAKTLKIAQPTCSRIIHDLVELGYLEQLGPKKGFVPGPKARTLLGGGGAYRDTLKETAWPIVHACAEAIHESVLVATFVKGRRYVLCHHNGNPELRVIIDQPFYEDLYITATGRVLLAHAPPEEQRLYVEKHGLPGDRWDDLSSPQALEGALRQIREDGHSLDTSTQLAKIAFPVRQGDKVVASLGSSVPKANFTGDNRGHIIREVSRAAAALSSALEDSAPL